VLKEVLAYATQASILKSRAFGFGAMTKAPHDIEQTKRLMAALGRMPPKPHEEMKVGKLRAKKAKSPVKRAAGKAKR
jgi:hypothetical protein